MSDELSPEMLEEAAPDLLTLEDEDGKEVTFEVIDATEVNGTRYLAVIPYQEDPESLQEDAELILMRIGTDDEGEYMDIVDDDEELITVGKVKEKYLRDAIAEYSKRLGRYCKLGIVEVADEKTPEHASDGLERQIKAKEGERIAKHIRDDAFVIALAIEGKQLTSEQLAAKINDLGLHGTSHIQLIIGGMLSDRLVVRDGPFAQGHGRQEALNVQNDVPAPADAGDSAGADLSRIQNQRRRTLPQVIFEAFRKKR